jgi:hypothetical protein
MSEQGFRAIFHSLEVPQQGVSLDTLLGPPKEMESNNTSPKSIDDYMRKSTQFDDGRTRSWSNISFPGGASTSRRPQHLVGATSGNGIQQHKFKIHGILYEKNCLVRLWQNRVLV